MKNPSSRPIQKTYRIVSLGQLRSCHASMEAIKTATQKASPATTAMHRVYTHVNEVYK